MCGADMHASSDDLYITQYYSGVNANDRWVEIWNGGEALDLEGVYLGIWTDIYSHEFRYDTDPQGLLALSGTIGAGETLLLSAPGAQMPAYSTAGIVSSELEKFNGNDSIGIFTEQAFRTQNLIDAIAFGGNYGGFEISYVRVNLNVGFSLSKSAPLEPIKAVWEDIELVEANEALAHEAQRVGRSGFEPVPEASAAALYIGACVGFFLLRRRRT